MLLCCEKTGGQRITLSLVTIILRVPDLVTIILRLPDREPDCALVHLLLDTSELVAIKGDAEYIEGDFSGFQHSWSDKKRSKQQG